MAERAACVDPPKVSHGVAYADQMRTGNVSKMAVMAAAAAKPVICAPVPPRTGLPFACGNIIDAIKSEITTFWDSVRAGEEPPVDFENDAEAVVRLLDFVPISDITLDQAHAELFQKYLEMVDLEKQAKTKKDQAKSKGKQKPKSKAPVVAEQSIFDVKPEDEVQQEKETEEGETESSDEETAD